MFCLTATARRDPHLIARYGSDVNVDMAVVVLMLGLVMVAIAITLSDRFVRVLWGKFYAAWQLFNEERALQSVANNQPL